MADVQAFGLKFSEAIDYLKGKVPAPTLAWDDLAGPVHSKVFAVAGAIKVDLVQDLHDAMTRAMAEGRSIGDFRKDFDKAVHQHGWTYKGKRGWRSRVIYDNNMRSAHMAGRWKQLIANADRKPYLQYKTAGDARVRPLHRQWNGLVYRIDHSFWLVYYPPNGYGCRCTVRALGPDEVKDLGLDVQEAMPKNMTRVVTDKAGEITDMVPHGIDPGWDHNVGVSWIAPEVALGEKLARLPLWLRGQMSQKAVVPAFQQVLNDQWSTFRAGVKATLQNGSLAASGQRGVAHIVGYLDAATVDALGVEGLALDSTAVAVLNNRALHLDGAAKMATNQPWPDTMIDNLPAAFANYKAVLWDTKPDQQALIFITQESVNGLLGKITMKINQKSRWGGAKQRIVSLVSLGAVDPSSFRARITVNGKAQQRYKVLLGQL